MPCSRSARSPSVTKDRSMSSMPRLRDAWATASSWSSKSWRVSKRRRPIRVDLPSSTDPMAANRRRSVAAGAPLAAGAGGGRVAESMRLEVSLALSVLHRRLREPVVGTRGAPLGQTGGGDLGDDLVDRDRLGAHGTGAGGVADGP